MGAIYEFTGVVKKVREIQRFESGFEKRELVVTDDVGTQPLYPNILCFSFKKERMNLLENVEPGLRVKVTFAVDGREWSDGAGKTRYFTDLTGINLEVYRIVDPRSEKIPGVVEKPKNEGDEDLPF